jgi:hypothetical protein
LLLWLVGQQRKELEKAQWRSILGRQSVHKNFQAWISLQCTLSALLNSQNPTGLTMVDSTGLWRKTSRMRHHTLKRRYPARIPSTSIAPSAWPRQTYHYPRSPCPLTPIQPDFRGWDFEFEWIRG